MAAKKKSKKKNKDNKIALASTASSHRYTTYKSKSPNKPGKLSLKKYDPIARKHVLYEEKKIK